MFSLFKMNDNVLWYFVRVFFLQLDGIWVDYVFGMVCVEFEGESGNSYNFGEEYKVVVEEVYEVLECVIVIVQEKMDMLIFYDECRVVGNDWGLSFVFLIEGYIGKGCGLVKMCIFDIFQCMLYG